MRGNPPTLRLQQWLADWHTWVCEHCRELNAANYFPRADDDTGKNLVSATQKLLPLLEEGVTPRQFADGVASHRPFGASGILVSAIVDGLSKLPIDEPVSVVAVSDVFASLASRQLYVRVEHPRVDRTLTFDETRGDGPPAAFELVARTMRSWPVDPTVVEADAKLVLARSAALNRPLWNQPGPPPPDAGSIALVGLLRIAVAQLVALRERVA